MFTAVVFTAIIAGLSFVGMLFVVGYAAGSKVEQGKHRIENFEHLAQKHHEEMVAGNVATVFSNLFGTVAQIITAALGQKVNTDERNNLRAETLEKLNAAKDEMEKLKANSQRAVQDVANKVGSDFEILVRQQNTMVKDLNTKIEKLQNDLQLVVQKCREDN